MQALKPCLFLSADKRIYIQLCFAALPIAFNLGQALYEQQVVACRAAQLEAR
jgi:hypothetical protein